MTNNLDFFNSVQLLGLTLPRYDSGYEVVDKRNVEEIKSEHKLDVLNYFSKGKNVDLVDQFYALLIFLRNLLRDKPTGYGHFEFIFCTHLQNFEILELKWQQKLKYLKKTCHATALSSETFTDRSGIVLSSLGLKSPTDVSYGCISTSTFINNIKKDKVCF